MSEVRNALFAWGSTSKQRTCRGCGCTDRHACPGGCSWVLLDLGMATGVCSSCAEELEWDPGRLVSIWEIEASPADLVAGAPRPTLVLP